MNKCIILEIYMGVVSLVETDKAWEEGQARLFTEDEAAARIDELNRENPHARYLVVNL